MKIFKETYLKYFSFFFLNMLMQVLITTTWRIRHLNLHDTVQRDSIACLVLTI